MTALYTSEPSDEDAQAFCEPVHVDTGFVYNTDSYLQNG